MGEITDKLDNILKSASPEQLDNIINDNWDDLLDDDREFTKFMRGIIRRNKIKWKNVYIAAGVSESYGQKVVAMDTHPKNRDLIIRLCMGMHLNLEEINHALKLYGVQELYSRDMRDMVIISAIHNRRFDPAEVDELLVEQGLKKLSAEIKDEK